jgi:hypothetical protein
MARFNRTLQLAKAVADSFEKAGFMPADLLQGPINLTDLAWQAPPLVCEESLHGIPLHNYLDYPMELSSEAAYEWYRLTLFNLLSAPEEVADDAAYKGLSKFLPKAKMGERRLALPLGEGWPAGSANTGPVFAMEVARLFRTSCTKVSEFVHTADDYYAVTPWGRVGIVDGFVHDMPGWDTDCRGHVQSLLEMPRGQISVLCQYDTVARLRGLLHENHEKFDEFAAVDYALQALRILANGNLCRELHQAIEALPLEAFKRRRRREAFEQALAVMENHTFTDRVKVSMILEMLVPAHWQLQVFARKIYNVQTVMPSVLSEKTESRIIRTLKWEAEKLK